MFNSKIGPQYGKLKASYLIVLLLPILGFVLWACEKDPDLSPQPDLPLDFDRRTYFIDQSWCLVLLATNDDLIEDFVPDSLLYRTRSFSSERNNPYFSIERNNNFGGRWNFIDQDSSRIRLLKTSFNGATLIGNFIRDTLAIEAPHPDTLLLINTPSSGGFEEHYIRCEDDRVRF